eukprot:6815856-Karenia_brevis.AAC.1
MDFDNRLELLLAELRGVDWDILVLTETWRKDKQEIFETKHGHTWCGSGGTRGQNGVGFLVNGRWEIDAFCSRCER